MTDKNMQMARRIAEAVAEAGGRVYYVGGLVRDRILGRENKDVDIEVHGVTPQVLESILDSLGQRTEMGASFGIYGLRHYELDIAMPRREKATGKGHKDFAVFTDPFLGTEKAAMRRDFTINAMMEDVLTGEIVDHFGGREDARNGVLRHVNDATFAEDPLRVLRAAQFAARFGFTVAKETIDLCRSMDLGALACERIFGELEKALIKADRPSVFFEVLREMNQLHIWFPELEALTGIPQPTKTHPEGDAWRHTMLALDQAALLRRQAKEALAFMLAALCHDLGKAAATRMIDGVPRAPGHGDEGMLLAGRFLSRLTSELRLNKYVSNMTQLHMFPRALFKQRADQTATNRLFYRSVCPEDLLLLAKSDALGRALKVDYAVEEAFLWERLAHFREIMSRPSVMGADLVAAGFRPGKDFSEVLAHALELHLAGVSKEEALPQAIACLQKLREADARA